MAERVLITGGAGFIGGHLGNRLLADGFQVRVLDNLLDQVHGQVDRPDYLSPQAELVRGDIRDRDLVRRALRDAIDLSFRLPPLRDVNVKEAIG